MIETTTSTTIQAEELKNILIQETETGFSVSLIDNEGDEIVRGFGTSVTEALNDLHSNLI
ncbi:MAG: hypothetical protein GC178_05335 [Flavobacteriales bacterium]|nr:hypothetical protein [Flavobacteriales bacterium]